MHHIGIPYSQIIILGSVTVYYITIICYCLIYLFYSLIYPLPWRKAEWYPQIFLKTQ
jgi:hypothetical protein